MDGRGRVRGARRDGPIEPALGKLLRVQIDLELAHRHPIETIGLFHDADVLEYQTFTWFARQRARVPEQTLLKQLVVARIVLQRGEERGEANHLADMVEARPRAE